jgi:hypothetical protein
MEQRSDHSCELGFDTCEECGKQVLIIHLAPADTTHEWFLFGHHEDKSYCRFSPMRPYYGKLRPESGHMPPEHNVPTHQGKFQ